MPELSLAVCTRQKGVVSELQAPAHCQEMWPQLGCPSLSEAEGNMLFGVMPASSLLLELDVIMDSLQR